MLGNTDTEFLYVLLLSLLESDSDEDVQRRFDHDLGIVQAMRLSISSALQSKWPWATARGATSARTRADVRWGLEERPAGHDDGLMLRSRCSVDGHFSM